MKAAVLISMALGALLALLGAIVGVLTRRPEVSLSEILLAGSSLAAHPERYVRPSAVSVIRALNLSGVLLFVAGVLVLVALAVTGTRLR